MNKRDVITKIVEPVDPPMALGDDLSALRRGFAKLMDRAARAVQRAGLEPDDCVVERGIRLTTGDAGDAVEIPVESLTERQRLLKPFHDKCLQTGAAVDDRAPVFVHELVVEAVRTPDFPRTGTQVA